MGESLLRWDALGGPADPRAVTVAVLERDRRRVGWMTVLTVLLWLLVVAAIAGMVWFHFIFLQPKLRFYAQQGGSRDAAAWATVAEWAAMAVLSTAMIALFAALSTIGLIYTTRRATLRQVNANLSVIAEELRALRAAKG